MLLALLIYSYATGTFSSRRIEQSTHDCGPVRLLTADTHSDHDTICALRCANQALLNESFVKVLQFTVAADGTKVLASASQHRDVSYARAGERITQLELEVAQLLVQAGQADATPLQDGLAITAEITRRQERGEKVGGPPPPAPTPTPQPKDQYNFTDPESRIMKAGGGQHFEQSDNAPAAVESGEPVDRGPVREPGTQRQTRVGADAPGHPRRGRIPWRRPWWRAASSAKKR